jgi:hypothetical protein
MCRIEWDLFRAEFPKFAFQSWDNIPIKLRSIMELTPPDRMRALMAASLFRGTTLGTELIRDTDLDER